MTLTARRENPLEMKRGYNAWLSLWLALQSEPSYGCYTQANGRSWILSRSCSCWPLATLLGPLYVHIYTVISLTGAMARSYLQFQSPPYIDILPTRNVISGLDAIQQSRQASCPSSVSLSLRLEPGCFAGLTELHLRFRATTRQPQHNDPRL